jgi:SAM-dependent methyltransferase
MTDPAAHWDRPDLATAVLDALAAAGRDLDGLTVESLAATDHFHGGGRPATERLAGLAAPGPGTEVLDVGGGLGGPARLLAERFGCSVTVIDITPSYVEAARELTARLGLADRVRHELGDALDLPFADASFDLVWTQNSGMNIADKAALYAGFRRVVRPGGMLAQQEPMAGPGGPPVYPVMWADDASSSFLWAPDELRALIEEAGFVARSWDDVTEEVQAPSGAAPAHSIQRLVMGERLEAIQAAGRRNAAEGRVRMVQATFAAR